MGEFPRRDNPLGIAVTHFLVVADLDRSLAFYEKLGGQVLRRQQPAVVQLGSGWLTINTGGEPTQDKPGIDLVTPDQLERDRVSGFLNLWVEDLDRIYQDWSTAGVQFLTAPVDLGHEKRAYFRDPDGHLVEVGERYFA